jgi:SNF2 family DNA or RNA helicase
MAKHFGGYEILGTRRPLLLRWELKPFMVRRTKMELGITEPSRIQRTLTLPVKHRREYDRLRKEFFVELEAHQGERRILAIPSVLARVTRLRQFLVDPGLIGSGLPSLKYGLVAEIMDELDKPPVIFTSFKQAALRLQMYLKKSHRRMWCLTGGMTDATLESNKKAFLMGQADGLIVVTKKGGESLNLGKYGNVIMLDMPWNGREVEQTEGRVDRPEEGTGIHVATTVFRCITEQSYEVKLLAKIEKKHHMFTEVMSPRDLKELFA